MVQQKPISGNARTALLAVYEAAIARRAAEVWLTGSLGLSLAALIAANTLPALPLLSAVAILAFAPIVVMTTKSAAKAKRSLPGVKARAGGQS